jgi:hypothetical protein
MKWITFISREKKKKYLKEKEKKEHGLTIIVWVVGNRNRRGWFPKHVSGSLHWLEYPL